MTYFTNIHTLDELKREYRRLAFANHPDRGGDVETMKAINAEYEAKKLHRYGAAFALCSSDKLVKCHAVSIRKLAQHDDVR